MGIFFTLYLIQLIQHFLFMPMPASINTSHFGKSVFDNRILHASAPLTLNVNLQLGSM